MHLKCAHPECSSDFDYTQGRLYRFQQSPKQDKQPTHWHGVKHYWLCARCCKGFTIEYQKGLGVLLMERLDAISGGRPSYCVLQADVEPKSSMSRRISRSRNRRTPGKAELRPMPASAIEILETRNLERRS